MAMRWWRQGKDLALPPVAARRLSVHDGDRSESVLFQTALDDERACAELVTPWESRAAALRAKRLVHGRGVALLQAAWAQQGPTQPFSPQELAAIGVYFGYFAIEAGREAVQQGEYGEYMLVQLSGVMAVERVDAAGQSLRLAETGVGDLIGEMSLLDLGQRFSSCVTLTACEVAVLTRKGLDEMVQNQPQLAARLIISLARKLSVRLRAVSAKLQQ